MTAAFEYGQAFSRNIGWITEQEQQVLRETRVAIAGMGGVGGSHLLTLTRLGIGRFSLSDFDRFGVENFNRQAGARLSSVGRPKLETLVEMALDINPHLDIRTFPQGIGAHNVDHFLSGASVYVGGFDFFAMDAQPVAISEHLARGVEHVRRALDGDDAGAESGLLGALRGDAVSRELADLWTGALFDLYRATVRSVARDAFGNKTAKSDARNADFAVAAPDLRASLPLTWMRVEDTPTLVLTWTVPGDGSGIIHPLAGVGPDFREARGQLRRHDGRFDQAEARPGAVGQGQGEDDAALAGRFRAFGRRALQQGQQAIRIEGQGAVALGDDQPFAARRQVGLVGVHPQISAGLCAGRGSEDQAEDEARDKQENQATRCALHKGSSR